MLLYNGVKAENPLNTHTYLAPWSSQLWPDRCAHTDTPLSAILAGGTCLWCIHSRNKEILFVLAEVEIALGQRDSLWGTALFQGTQCVCRGETFLLSITPSFTTTCLGPLLISQVPFPNWKWRWNTKYVLVFWKWLRALCVHVQLCLTFLLPYALYVACQAPVCGIF